MNTAESSKDIYRQKRIEHWDEIARQMDTWKGWSEYYHRHLLEVYKHLVAPGQRIIEIGCARGELLSALKPEVGVGVDFSNAMIKRASILYPNLRFINSDAHDLNLNEKYDVIILSDLVNDLWDVQSVFQKLAALSMPRTRLIINSYSRVWELPLAIARHLGFAKPVLNQNWLTVDDIISLLNLSNFEPIRHWQEMLVPLPIPFLSNLANRFFAKIWPFRLFALTNFVLARPFQQNIQQDDKPRVSVIIPARNEEGNIPDIFARVPKMGIDTELVFVEGHSTDETYSAIEKNISNHLEVKCKLLQQRGKGKGDAVRMGFDHANGDILMILDSDLTVPPEDLSRFYDALLSGKGEFINGVRLVYPMEKEAMSFINLVGNKFFSLAFSWLLGQPIKDTLCGTKVLWKSNYELIKTNRAYFGDFDPFGDFDLIFGASKLNLKILDLPIRYRERKYGTTNIKRWKHAFLLFRMVFFAARRIKFK